MRLISAIRLGSKNETFRVRATKNAITKDYVRILQHSGSSGSARYAEFKEIEDDETISVDKEYYIRAVNGCLRSICLSMGLPDEKFKTAY
jgi:hypothetical protein